MGLDADPYRTLGLSRGASLDEVKRAYRRLAKTNHPDAAGSGALQRFLAIQAAYEQLAGDASTTASRSPGAPSARPRPAAADPDRTEATRRAYGDRPRQSRSGADSKGGPRPKPASGGPTQARPARGKATLGSTSYDDADAGSFEPDWGGASWYGTTSGTYWTINPKEYADPRKHGPEYQARARRATRARPGDAERDPEAAPSPRPPGPPGRPGPPGPPGPEQAGSPADARAAGLDEPAPDPARAAVDLGRALTDSRSGGPRGRLLRAVLGWLPMAMGLGWLVGEVTGCGRFAATCDPSVAPLTVAGQGIVLVALLLLPGVAAVVAGAALALLAAAVVVSLVLSATGAAADEASRRAALTAVLLVAWLGGLAVAIVRRTRAGPRPARPVS